MTGWTRRISKAAATAAIATGALLMAVAPASAAPTNCTSGAMCMWKDTNYLTSGLHFDREFQYYYTDFGYLYWNYTTVDDNVSSVYNNGNTYAAVLFSEPRGQGTMKFFSKKVGYTSLGSFDNKASSGYFCSYTSVC